MAVNSVPVFPLGTVLFPGTPIHLHIFEPRYQRMTKRILSEKCGFVVSLIESGQEALSSLAQPSLVGTMAAIEDYEMLKAGRMNLTGAGLERVRLSSLHEHPDGYLEALAEPFPFPDAHSTEMREASALLRHTAAEYFEILRTIKQTASFELPAAGAGLIFLCAAVLPVPVTERQGFLEASSLAFLARDLRERYAHYIHLMQAGQMKMAASAHLN